MYRTISLFILTLAALLSPRPVLAYPNSDARYTLTVKDVSWTVLQDHKDPLKWYYLPAAASLFEPVKRQPWLALFKSQVPAPGDSQTLIGNTRFLLTLSLAPEKAALEDLATAVAGLKPMLDRKAAAKDLSLESVQLNEAKVSLSDAGGKLLAGAAAIEAVGPGAPAAGISFYLKTEGEMAEKIENLLLADGGVKIAVDYAYTAGALKPGAARPGPAVFQGQASGTVGLGAYTKEVQDKSVVIFPPFDPASGFFQLPAVADLPGLKVVTYNISIVDPDGKEGKVPAQMARWSAKSGTIGWSDVRGNLRQTLLFPTVGVLENARATGKDVSAYKFRVKGEATFSRGADIAKKAEGDTAFFTGGIPFGSAYSPFRIVSVYGDFLAFTTQDSASNLAAVKLVVSCGKQKENFALTASKDGKLNMNPSTAFFDKACGNVGLEASYIEKGGKQYKKVFADLVQGRDSAIYLENYTE